MAVETRLAKVVVLGIIYALSDFVDVDVQAKPLADPLSDFRAGWVRM